MAGTRKERLAQAARKAAAYKEVIDFDKFEYLASRGDTTARLPLDITVEQGAQFRDAVEKDDINAYLERVAEWGYPETAATLNTWPKLAVLAVIKGWLTKMEEIQDLALGE